jgi:hypothetical protein
MKSHISKKEANKWIQKLKQAIEAGFEAGADTVSFQTAMADLAATMQAYGRHAEFPKFRDKFPKAPSTSSGSKDGGWQAKWNRRNSFQTALDLDAMLDHHAMDFDQEHDQKQRETQARTVDEERSTRSTEVFPPPVQVPSQTGQKETKDGTKDEARTVDEERSTRSTEVFPPPVQVLSQPGQKGTKDRTKEKVTERKKESGVGFEVDDRVLALQWVAEIVPTGTNGTIVQVVDPKDKEMPKRVNVSWDNGMWTLVYAPFSQLKLKALEARTVDKERSTRSTEVPPPPVQAVEETPPTPPPRRKKRERGGSTTTKMETKEEEEAVELPMPLKRPEGVSEVEWEYWGREKKQDRMKAAAVNAAANKAAFLSTQPPKVAEVFDHTRAWVKADVVKVEDEMVSFTYYIGPRGRQTAVGGSLPVASTKLAVLGTHRRAQDRTRQFSEAKYGPAVFTNKQIADEPNVKKTQARRQEPPTTEDTVEEDEGIHSRSSSLSPSHSDSEEGEKEHPRERHRQRSEEELHQTSLSSTKLDGDEDHGFSRTKSAKQRDSGLGYESEDPVTYQESSLKDEMARGLTVLGSQKGHSQELRTPGLVEETVS